MKRGRRLITAAMAFVAAVAALFVAATPAAAVVGGTTVSWDSYPYLVDLQVASGSCHGTVISDSWILTAGHCITASDVSNPGGVLVTGAPPSGSGGEYEWHPVQIVPHPLWDGNQDHGHDLALIRVASGALATIAPVQVGAPWDAGAYAAGLTATIMGNPTIGSINGTVAIDVAQVPVQSDSYMASLYNPWINALMIGAGTSQQTSCFGDSGGPLVVTRNSRPVEIGVVSFGGQACNTAAGFAELSGPQLAWVASTVPSIIAGWGTCTAADGTLGRTVVAYGPTTAAGTVTDGPNYWTLGCGGNVGPAASASASSENPSTGQLASKAIDGVIAGYPGDYTKEWATVHGGAGSWLTLNWSSPQLVGALVLSDRPNLNDQITGGTIQFSDGSSLTVGPLANDGSPTVLLFPAKTITSLQLTVTAVSSTTINVGLAEIQVYSARVVVPNVLGMTQTNATSVITKAGLTVGTVSQDNRCIDVAGTVLAQSPTGGAVVAPGSAVSLVVSSGVTSTGKPCVFQ